MANLKVGDSNIDNISFVKNKNFEVHYMLGGKQYSAVCKEAYDVKGVEPDWLDLVIHRSPLDANQNYWVVSEKSTGIGIWVFKKDFQVNGETYSFKRRRACVQFCLELILYNGREKMLAIVEGVRTGTKKPVTEKERALNEAIKKNVFGRENAQN